MFPRLIIVSVVSLAALSGCKHRDSFGEFGGPNASVQPVAMEQRANPLARIRDLFFREHEATVADVYEEDDTISYVDPVTPPYKTAATTHRPSHRVETHGESSIKDAAYADEMETLPAYTLDHGDRVRMFVYDQPNLSRVYNVDGQGRISIPLVGSVLARGRTTRTLEGIVKRGLEGKYVKDAKVSIEVAVYRPFFIHGEVRTPGQFAYVYGMTVEAAIATAGGFSPRARKRDIKIARTVDGSRDMIVTDTSAFVRPGDVIMVDERFF